MKIKKEVFELDKGVEVLKIVRIDEPDFGCEGRPDGIPVTDNIYLLDESGEEQMIPMEEQLVWQRGLDEGMTVCYDEEGQLRCLAGAEKQEGI